MTVSSEKYGTTATKTFKSHGVVPHPWHKDINK